MDAFGAPAGGVVVEDLLLTDHFLIKGRVAGKFHRLSNTLEVLQKTFLCIEHATLVPLAGGEPVRTKRVQVNQSEIVLAHELVDLAGDSTQRTLATDQKTQRIRAYFDGRVQLELTGRVQPGAFEPRNGPTSGYFIMQEPVLRGLNLRSRPELEILESLGYAIVPRGRMSYVYEID